MKAAIDTSSLISLVRYYLPFDKQAVLFDLFQKKIQNKEIILLDRVVDECRNTSKGIVFTSLPFLTDKDFLKKYHPFINTEALLPPSPTKFFNQLDNTFINGEFLFNYGRDDSIKGFQRFDKKIKFLSKLLKLTYNIGMILFWLNLALTAYILIAIPIN